MLAGKISEERSNLGLRLIEPADLTAIINNEDQPTMYLQLKMAINSNEEVKLEGETA